jgi:hypothetical protein
MRGARLLKKSSRRRRRTWLRDHNREGTDDGTKFAFTQLVALTNRPGNANRVAHMEMKFARLSNVLDGGFDEKALAGLR